MLCIVTLYQYFKIKLSSKYKLIICALRNYNFNSREKFKPRPGFEPRTYRSQQAWHSTIWVIMLNWLHRSKLSSWKQCYAIFLLNLNSIFDDVIVACTVIKDAKGFCGKQWIIIQDMRNCLLRILLQLLASIAEKGMWCV